MNKYQDMEACIHVPDGLNERVIRAACEGKRRERSRSAIRGAVCAACALALVLGTVSLGESAAPAPEQPGSTVEHLYRPLILNYSFGITAGAVENAANGGLIFRWENGSGSFRISGENIREIFLQTSKGTLMKDWEVHGSCIREPFCADAVYRLAATEGDQVEAVDQAELLLEVTFVDGTVKEERYTLHAEKLRAFFNEDGREVLVPALKGDRDGDIPALYLEGREARWLAWPVADSQTVSLSMSYGFQRRVNADNGAFHTGIDIPGAGGMKIAAAEAGCVVETGYDSRQGNYLVIDHGDGLTTRYAHCQEVLVVRGAVVEKGQEIALMGSTGMSTGPHLHFEVRQDGAAQNPVAYFKGEIRDTLHAQ